MATTLFHGIGSHFDNLKSGAGVMGTGLKASQLAQKIGAHAMAGGVLAVLNGGKFGHGFASAGVTEALNPAISALTPFSAGQYVASMVVGGTTSVIAGGKFANGAVTASFSWLLITEDTTTENLLMRSSVNVRAETAGWQPQRC